MSDLQCQLNQNIMSISMAKVAVSNAFDDKLLLEIRQAIQDADANPKVRVILLRAEGKHFCAGADINWMQRMRHYSEADNIKDSMILADTMDALYHTNKPTIAVVQGASFGGGAGLVAACDIAVAEENAVFCFSEVKLGLIPAVISPYVIEAIGARAAKHLFMSAEKFDASKALRLGLIHHCVPRSELDLLAESIATKLTQVAPVATQTIKRLVQHVSGKPIDAELQQYTARLIAKTRVSKEGQRGLQAFIDKAPLDWSQEE